MKRIDAYYEMNGQRLGWTFLTNDDGQSLFVNIDGSLKQLDSACGYDNPRQMKKAMRAWICSWLGGAPKRLSYDMKFYY